MASTYHIVSEKGKTFDLVGKGHMSHGMADAGYVCRGTHQECLYVYDQRYKTKDSVLVDETQSDHNENW
jgi:hypothetical protein